jgi:hypothetical protein
VKKTSKYRELYQLIVSSNSEIKILETCSSEGDVRFEVPILSLLQTYQNYEKYKKELSSCFSANFIGEFLVRENMDKFVDILTNLKDEYMPVVNKYIHRSFGMFTIKDKFHFVLNINHIQNIMTEDLYKRI